MTSAELLHWLEQGGTDPRVLRNLTLVNGADIDRVDAILTARREAEGASETGAMTFAWITRQLPCLVANVRTTCYDGYTQQDLVEIGPGGKALIADSAALAQVVFSLSRRCFVTPDSAPNVKHLQQGYLSLWMPTEYGLMLTINHMTAEPVISLHLPYHDALTQMWSAHLAQEARLSLFSELLAALDATDSPRLRLTTRRDDVLNYVRRFLAPFAIGDILAAMAEHGSHVDAVHLLAERLAVLGQPMPARRP